MPALAFNNVYGALGSALSSSGTTITFGVAPSQFPTLTSGQYIKLELEPGTTNYEIVYLTAYTSGSLTGTITRAAESASAWPAVSHAAGVTWVNAPSVSDFAPQVFNVKSYGAVGDGVTDDTAAITAANQDCASTGVLFSPSAVSTISSSYGSLTLTAAQASQIALGTVVTGPGITGWAYVDFITTTPVANPVVYITTVTGNQGVTGSISTLTTGVYQFGLGGSLYFPSGTYVTGPQVHYANVTWVGASRTSTTIQLKAQTSSADLLTSQGFSAYIGTPRSGPADFGLRNLTLDANKYAHTSGFDAYGNPNIYRCWTAFGTGYFIDDVYFVNGRGGGVYTCGPGGPNVTGFVEPFLNNFKVWNYGNGDGNFGWEHHGAHDLIANNGVIATVDSSVHGTDSSAIPAFSASPINVGTSATATIVTGGNSPTTPFTFTCTNTIPTSSPLTGYSTSGGVFLCPVTTITAGQAYTTWALISYTGIATVGGHTNDTFTGCTTLIGNNGGIQVFYDSTNSYHISNPTFGYMHSDWQQNATPTTIISTPSTTAATTTSSLTWQSASTVPVSSTAPFSSTGGYAYFITAGNNRLFSYTGYSGSNLQGVVAVTPGLQNAPAGSTTIPIGTSIGIPGSMTFTQLAFGPNIGSTPLKGSVNGSIQGGQTFVANTGHGGSAGGVGTGNSATVIANDPNHANSVLYYDVYAVACAPTSGTSYTFSAGATSVGGQLSNIHVWGRNHVGYFADIYEWSVNNEVEGAQVANVVLNNVNIAWKGGTIYGTNGQAGQVFEVGLQLGQDTGVRTANVDVTIYNVGSTTGGWSINSTSRTSGNNMIRATGVSPTGVVFVLNPYNADFYEIVDKTTTGSFTTNPTPASFGSTVTVTGALKSQSTVTGSFASTSTTGVGAYTLASNATVLYTGAGTAGWNLPTPTAGLRYTLINSTAYAVTLTPSSGNINSSGTYTLAANSTTNIVGDGTNWWTC